MALAVLLATLVALPSYIVYRYFAYLSGLARSIAQARASGLTYIILPFHPRKPSWQINRARALPWILRLPVSWRDRWLPFLLIEQAWHQGHAPFEKLGSDTVIAATPEGCVLFTCDPVASQQIYRDGAFDKPTKFLQVLNAFGPALTASSGSEGKLYRRTVAPFFSEQNMRQIWKSSISASGHLTRALTTQKDAYQKLREIMTKFTLGLLSELAFEVKTDFAKELRFEEDVPTNHKMSYSEAIIQATENMLAYFIIPPAALPKVNPSAYTAKTEFLQYVSELKEKKEKERSASSSPDKSLLGWLIYVCRTDETVADKMNKALIVDQHVKTRDKTEEKYSTEAVNGNFFILNLAGFESSANQIAFMVSILACRPELQKLIQKDLDRILGDTPAKDWTYEKHFNPLMSSYVGATIHETLRTFPVIPTNPRLSSEGPTVPSLVLDGKMHVLPRGMLCLVNSSATHRNPKYWKTAQPDARARKAAGPGLHEQAPFPLMEFDPSRWLVQEEKGGAATLLTPEPGSFVAFSEGSRACLGRRFALIEICAVVSVLLRQFTAELVVEDGATAQDALAKAEWSLSAGVQFGHSLRATRSVPVRFVPRG